MSSRNYVPPPGAARSPNGAPGREFWMNRDDGDTDNQIGPAIVATAPNPSLPNLTRQNLAAQLFVMFFGQGNDAATATALANARALQMIP